MPRTSTSLMTGEITVAVPGHGTEAVSCRLGALFDAHHQRLYRLARRMSSNAEDARDLVQETFLRAAGHLRSVPEGASHEEAWLVRVLVNLTKDRWRQAAARQRLDALHPPAPSGGEPDPEMALVARSVVWTALAALPPRRRAIVILHELEGAGFDSIAATLGITAVTVRWHVSRGRAQLVEAVRRQGGIT